MPQITIYVDAELAEQIKAAGVSPSAVCQRALRKAVAARSYLPGVKAARIARPTEKYTRRSGEKRRTP